MSSALSESELRSMRADFAAHLSAKGTIYRKHEEKDDTARTRLVYLPVSGLTSVRCDVEKPTSQTVAEIATRTTASHERAIVFPHGTAVLEGDLVKVGTDIWEVIGTDADRTATLGLRCEVISDTEERVPG